jgi:hypothetical protein
MVWLGTAPDLDLGQGFDRTPARLFSARNLRAGQMSQFDWTYALLLAATLAMAGGAIVVLLFAM